MKRRLSVAISLIGSPKVAYLDEPSTGAQHATCVGLTDWRSPTVAYKLGRLQVCVMSCVACAP